MTSDVSPVLEIVRSKVLTRRNDPRIRRPDTILQAIDETIHISGDMKRILARRLLTTAPTWILGRVDVRSPEIQTGMTRVAKRATLDTDHGGNLFDEVVVEHGAQHNRRRE